MAQGRVVAVGGEVRIHARLLAPGVHAVIPFVYAVRRNELVRIDEQLSDDEAPPGDDDDAAPPSDDDASAPLSEDT